MYFISVILLLTVFPAGSVAIDLVWGGGADKNGADWQVVCILGNWCSAFYGWNAPSCTASIHGRRYLRNNKASFAIVREVGFGNLAMGALGLLSLAQSTWVIPAAIVGGLYYGLAGIGHIIRGRLNFAGWVGADV